MGRIMGRDMEDKFSIKNESPKKGLGKGVKTSCPVRHISWHIISSRQRSCRDQANFIFRET